MKDSMLQTFQSVASSTSSALITVERVGTVVSACSDSSIEFILERRTSGRKKVEEESVSLSPQFYH